VSVTYLISPTENELAKLLGDKAIVSPLPEERGADILIYTSQGTVGIQRKAVPCDFISSVEDGRLARCTSLLSKSVKFPLLLCEGRFKYFPDGHLLIRPRVPSRYTRSSIKSLLMDIKFIKGVDYDFTEDTHDTVHYMKVLTDFIEKEKHFGLYARPSAQGVWIIPTAKEEELWILQGFSGIGPATAEKVIKHFGRIPLEWTCTLEELCRVDGLPVKKAEYMHEFFRTRGQRHDNTPKQSLSSLEQLLATLQNLNSNT
jgi:ERCC4-type nuclease